MSDLPLGVGAVDLTPVVRAVDLPESAQMSPSSPPVTALEDSAVLSVPMSPNRV